MELLGDESQDIFLLHFIIDSLKGYQRNIAMRFVDVDEAEDEEDEEESACTTRWRYFWFFCLILYFLWPASTSFCSACVWGLVEWIWLTEWASPSCRRA